MKKYLGLLIAFVLIFSMIGCTSPDAEEPKSNEGTETSEVVDEEEDNTSEEVESGPQYGGTLTVTDFAFTDVKSLDPHVVGAAGEMRHIENMYNGLLRYKEGSYGEVEGDLAKSFSVSEDNKTYTFNLYENVTFHNGDPLTSADVKYSIERIIDEEVRASFFDQLESIETPDENTVVIKLNQPVAPFTTFLANPMIAIVNKNIVEENGGSLATADAGSGPFMLESWQKDQQMTLVKFDGYFEEGLPYLDSVVFKPISEDSARNTALRTGEIDLILQITPKDAMTLESESSIVIDSVPGSYWEYIGMNMRDGPLAVKEVRQAIANGINREEMNQAIKFGEATVLTGSMIPPGHWAYADLNMYPDQNLEKAKSLLKVGGYPDGFDVEMIVLSNSDIAISAAQMAKQQLAPLGINITVNALESSVYFEKLGSGDFELTEIGWVGFVDPDEFLYNIFYTDQKWNQQGYSNSEFDALLDEGRTTLDQNKRKEIYYEAQKILAEDAPMAFLYVNNQISAYQDYVKGFDVNATVTLKSLKNTWLEK